MIKIQIHLIYCNPKVIIILIQWDIRYMLFDQQTNRRCDKGLQSEVFKKLLKLNDKKTTQIETLEKDE